MDPSATTLRPPPALTVAIGAGWSLAVRLALVACVIAVSVPVRSSLHVFPSPEIR